MLHTMKNEQFTPDRHDANLIAASKDMYEALVEIEQFLTSYEIFDRDGRSMYEDISGTIEIIQAVLAKANPQSV